MSGVPKQEVEQQGPYIRLKVQNQNSRDNHVFFKVRRSAQLKKLMTQYCDRESVEHNTYVFLFDGTRIRPHQTPEELGMEDGDEIDAMLPQTGGFAI